MYVVYSLIDPRDQITRYIGITNDLYERFKQHMSCKEANILKNAWIQDMLDNHVLMIMHTLETVETVEEARKSELLRVKKCIEANLPLFNIQIAYQQAICIDLQLPLSDEELETHFTYQEQYRKCGKAYCNTCSQGKGHGPYWYAYWREGGRLRSRYIGKLNSQ